MIASSIEGRIRIRDERLKKGVFADSLKKLLQSSGKLLDVHINQCSGSMLIIYNPSVIDSKTLFELIGEDIDVEETGRNTTMKRDNKTILSWLMSNYITRVNQKAMFFSLAKNLIPIAFGQKKYHVIAGFIFIGMLGVHLLIHRRTPLK